MHRQTENRLRTLFGHRKLASPPTQLGKSWLQVQRLVVVDRRWHLIVGKSLPAFIAGSMAWPDCVQGPRRITTRRRFRNKEFLAQTFVVIIRYPTAFNEFVRE